MEEELGRLLFLRDNRTVELTPSGQQLKAFAQQTLLHYQQLRNALSQEDESLSGELRLFCSVTAAYSHLPTILDRFRALHPSVEIKLTTGDAADAVEKVQSNDVDLAIAGRPENLPTSVEFHKIGEVPLVMIAPSLPCPVQALMAVDKPDWASIPFILPEHGPTRRRIDQWFRRHHISNPLIYATVAGHEAIVSMVALGCGIALLPNVVLDNSPESVRRRITVAENVAQTSAFDLGVCVQKKRLSEPLIHAFWQLI